ncbi:MAG: GNAT family N-acetyltransferase [Cyclobacteriaceae bacterium]
MVRRLLDDCLYTNLGIFPAVPKNCTGIRFTLTLHHEIGDIEQLADRIAYHLPKALKEEGRTIEDVSRAFRNTADFSKPLEKYSPGNNRKSQPIEPHHKFNITFKTTIEEIPKPLWDKLLGDKGAFDSYNLALLEKSFQGNERPEDNWKFSYYVVTDSKQNPVLATFFVKALTKMDMLSKPIISKKLEDLRTKDFYYLTSQSLMMGTPLTEGQHLYLDRTHPGWKESFMLLLDFIWAKQDYEQTDLLLLRDFNEGDDELQSFLLDLGFMKTHTPASHVIENLEVSSMEEYVKQLSSKKRYHIRKDVLDRAHTFEIENVLDLSNLDYLYELYENVVNHSHEINTFKFPKKLIGNMIKSKKWDVFALKLKSTHDPRPERLPIAVEFSYKNGNVYYPILIGLNYNFLENSKVYKQLLYRIMERAIKLGCKKICFGLTASLEKRKLGAVAKSQVAYVKTKDTFNVSLLNLITSI